MPEMISFWSFETFLAWNYAWTMFHSQCCTANQLTGFNKSDSQCCTANQLTGFNKSVILVWFGSIIQEKQSTNSILWK